MEWLITLGVGLAVIVGIEPGFVILGLATPSDKEGGE